MIIKKHIPYIIFLFIVSQNLNSDVIVFDDMYKNDYSDEVYVSKKVKKTKIQKITTIHKNVKAPEKIEKVIKAPHVAVKALHKEDTEISHKSKLAKVKLDTLLERYKDIIKNSGNKSEKKELFQELKQRFSSNNFNQYDTIAILNALEDIEQNKVEKYEALLTIDTMIEEIK